MSLEQFRETPDSKTCLTRVDYFQFKYVIGEFEVKNLRNISLSLQHQSCYYKVFGSLLSGKGITCAKYKGL